MLGGKPLLCTHSFERFQNFSVSSRKFAPEVFAETEAGSPVHAARSRGGHHRFHAELAQRGCHLVHLPRAAFTVNHYTADHVVSPRSPIDARKAFVERLEDLLLGAIFARAQTRCGVLAWRSYATTRAKPACFRPLVR